MSYLKKFEGKEELSIADRRKSKLKSTNILSSNVNPFNKNIIWKNKNTDNHRYHEIKILSANKYHKNSNYQEEVKENCIDINILPIKENSKIENNKENFNKYKKKNYSENEYSYMNALSQYEKINKEIGLKESINDNGYNNIKTKSSSKLAPINHSKNNYLKIKTNNYIFNSVQKIVKPKNVEQLYDNNKKIIVDNQKYEKEMTNDFRRTNYKGRFSNNYQYRNKNENKNLLGNKNTNIKEEEEIKYKIERKKYDEKLDNLYELKASGKKRKREKETKEYEIEEKSRLDSRYDISKKDDKKTNEKEQKYRHRIIEQSKLNSYINDINKKNKVLESINYNNQSLINENKKLEKIINEIKEKIKESESKIKLRED